jgi:hypothetical protein
MMQKRFGSFEDRLAEEMQRLSEQAQTVPAGQERDALLKKVRQAKVAAEISQWLSSPGLQPPTALAAIERTKII